MRGIILALVLYSLVFLLSELGSRRFSWPLLLSRKLAHITGSLVSFCLPYLMSSGQAVFIGLFFSLLLLISKRKKIFASIHDQAGRSWGEVLFPLGIAVSAFFIWPLSIGAYQGSCLILGLADGLAGYLGSIYGQRKFNITSGSKTIEGTIIFFLTTVTILGLYNYLYSSGVSWGSMVILVFYALVVTLTEAIFSAGWDNLVIPIVAGWLLLLIIR